MGLVYEVEHSDEGSRWAAKVLAHELGDRRDLVRRLLFEAEVLGRLDHPNLVRVVEAGTSANGRVYYVMELLRGQTLREALLDTVAFAAAPACQMVVQLLGGLGAAHAEGLVHRDIKPENVFLCEGGVVKLLDFGIAKNVYAMPAGAPLTPVSGPGVVGTLRYAAPECIEGKRASLLSDIYSVGAVFWEMLTGRLPFNVESRFEMFSAIVHQGIPSLGELRPDLPPEVRALVARATAIEPGARFPSVTAFAEATRLALEHLPPHDAPARAPRLDGAPARAPRLDDAPARAPRLDGAPARAPRLDDAPARAPRPASVPPAAPLQNDTEVDLLEPTMTPPPPESPPALGPRSLPYRRSSRPPPSERGRLLLERLQPRQADKVFLDVEELARRTPEWADALLDSQPPGSAGEGGDEP
jgi:serine/threonine-protein kinase